MSLHFIALWKRWHFASIHIMLFHMAFQHLSTHMSFTLWSISVINSNIKDLKPLTHLTVDLFIYFSEKKTLYILWFMIYQTSGNNNVWSKITMVKTRWLWLEHRFLIMCVHASTRIVIDRIWWLDQVGLCRCLYKV